jgi:hypothetical protein
MMPPAPLWIAAMVVVGVAAFGVIVTLYLLQRGPGRGALAPMALAVASMPLVVGLAGAARHLIRAFAGMAVDGTGGAAQVMAACNEAKLLMRLGAAAVLVILPVAAGLGWIGRGTTVETRSASPRRLAAWLALSLLAPVLVSGLHYTLTSTIVTIEEVMFEPSPGEISEERQEKWPSIAELSAHIARKLHIGVLGGPWLLIVLCGVAAVSTILAWRVAAPTAFVAVETLWLLAMAAAAGLAVLWP